MYDLENVTILVTGGAGFIGSHTVDLLVAQGARVRVLDNYSTGRVEHLLQVANRIELIEGDIRNRDDCARAMVGIDRVLHLAAVSSVSYSLQEPAATIATNVGGTANVLQTARDAGITQVVYASSASVYGTDAPLPNREGFEGKVTSPYALSKLMTEQLAQIYADCYGMALVGLRYFNVYGPRQDPNGAYAPVIPRFLLACAAGRSPLIYGSGEQTRDFIFVRDVAEANLAAVASQGVMSAAYNVGTGVSSTIRQVAEAITCMAKQSVPLACEAARSGELLHSRADTSLFSKTFSLRPATTLIDGLTITTDAFLAGHSPPVRG